jgi:hypothetical protein
MDLKADSFSCRVAQENVILSVCGKKGASLTSSHGLMTSSHELMTSSHEYFSLSHELIGYYFEFYRVTKIIGWKRNAAIVVVEPVLALSHTHSIYQPDK